MAKHTPSPWIADDIGTQDGAVVRISAYDGTSTYYHRCMVIAECWVRDDEDDKDSPNILQAEANARLIAAAPELLEALRECLALVRIKYGNLDADVNAVVGRADLAVSKTTTPAQRSEA